MAVTQLGPTRVDLASPGEVRDIVLAALKEREHYRGIKDMRRSTFLNPAAATRFTLTDGIGPESGYVWAVRIVTVQLSSAGTGQVYITSDTSTADGTAQQRNLLWQFGTSSTFQTQLFNSGAAIIKPDEGLFLNFSQTITGYMLSGWQVPAEMVGKLA